MNTPDYKTNKILQTVRRMYQPDHIKQVRCGPEPAFFLSYPLTSASLSSLSFPFFVPLALRPRVHGLLQEVHHRL